MRNARGRRIPPYHGSRYARGMSIPDEDVSQLTRHTWRVKSREGILLYQVRNIRTICRERGCPHHVTDICMHRYICSCPDNQNPCKHIYKVHHLLHQQEQNDAVPLLVRNQLYSLLEKLWQVVGSRRLSMVSAEQVRRALRDLIRLHYNI